MRGHPLRRVSVSIATLVAALSVALLASMPAFANGPPTGKIYDCYHYNALAGLTLYVQAIEIKPGSVYLVAPMREGNHLVGGVAAGRYRMHGHKITWIGGPYGRLHWSGGFLPAVRGHYRAGKENDYDNRIELFDNQRDDTGITCYEH